MGRADRLKEVYEYVRTQFPIHTQSDFAERLKYNRAYISSAMHGNEKNLTDKLFTNICEAFPGVFDLDYLLTGKDSLLTDAKEKQATPPVQQPAADLLELYAQRIRLVDDLRTSLKEEIAEVHALRKELQQARDDFRDATYRLTQALSRINQKSDNSQIMGIAADEATTNY